jgi:two-component system nitrogen regulation sensor histidine kinase NtrY
MTAHDPRPDLSLDARRRRNEIRIMLGIAAALAILFTGEYLFYRTRGVYPYGLNLVFFGLINVNVVLIITLLFLILRNVTKLVFEGRRKVFGSKLRTKLVAAFVGFATVPTVLFFYVSQTFVTSAIDRWFNIQVEGALGRSLEVARTYYKSIEEESRRTASRTADRLTGSPLLAPDRQADLIAALDEVVATEGAARVVYKSAAGDTVVKSKTSHLPKNVKSRVPDALARKGLNGETASDLETVRGTELVYGVAPVYADAARREVAGTVIATLLVPREMVGKAEEIRRSFEEYKQLKVMQTPIKASYLILLVLISLLIFFSATWFGFYLSRGFVRPVERLAAATRKVADGDLDFRLPVESSDEFGQLTDAFNTMTADLAASKEETLYVNRELEAGRRYRDTVLKVIPAGVMSLDPEGRIVTANTEVMRMLQFSDPDPVGKPFDRVLVRHHQEVVADLLRESRETGAETVMRQADVSVRDRILSVTISCTRLADDDGRPIGSVLVLDDLTELLRAQRMAAWQEVARRIAHEIKNPLTPIQLSAQRLQKRYADRLGEDGEVFADCTRMIVQQVEEMKQLVNEFSKFARMAEIKPTPNDLNEIVGEAILLYQEAHKRIAFTFERDVDLPVFRLDRDQVKRVLINILDNAVAAIAGTGQVVVTTRLQPETNAAILEVADTGVGIPREYRSRLFEPYFSTKRRGTGLGLAIVNRIVQDHNGYIRVRDNTPRGTIVSIEFPLGPKGRSRAA